MFTGGEDSKFFSNGLDLNWFAKIGGEGAQNFIINSVWRTLGRIMVLGVPTVAAINGHAFGRLCLTQIIELRMECSERFVSW